MFYNLQRECNPDDYFSFVKNEMIPSIEDEETADEVRRWINCTSGWLRRYMKFATGCMSDRELERFYKDTLNLIEEGIRSREWQMGTVDDELREMEDLWNNEVITDEEWEEAKYISSEIKDALRDDIDELKRAQDLCVKAENRFGMVACIEKVASMSHSRGSMLPVMCGAYLPENLYEAVTGREEWREYVDPRDAGLELSKATPEVFECIKNFKY